MTDQVLLVDGEAGGEPGAVGELEDRVLVPRERPAQVPHRHRRDGGPQALQQVEDRAGDRGREGAGQVVLVEGTQPAPGAVEPGGIRPNIPGQIRAVTSPASEILLSRYLPA